ncbi:MAG: hypothetical protein AB7I30_00775 [Isosphaeraceae bacterium]
MPTPVEFLRRYRALEVHAVMDDPVAKVCRESTHLIQLKNYFMMNWKEGTEQRKDYVEVTSGGSKTHTWFQANKERIRTAAMGKGEPRDYELALEWAVRSGKIPNANQASIQLYCDEHLGIDCSGFVTNYLIANKLRSDTSEARRNTGAASYFNASRAVNDPNAIRQGDLLVWMTAANSVMTSPAGHVAVVESHVAQSRIGGNLRVVEATGAEGANPKLLESMYTVERIIEKGKVVPAMILVVKRHGQSGSRVAVIRP